MYDSREIVDLKGVESTITITIGGNIGFINIYNEWDSLTICVDEEILEEVIDQLEGLRHELQSRT